MMKNGMNSIWGMTGIDLVENKFSKNSIAPKESRFDLLDNVDDMFRVIREKAG